MCQVKGMVRGKNWPEVEVRTWTSKLDGAGWWLAVALPCFVTWIKLISLSESVSSVKWE